MDSFIKLFGEPTKISKDTYTFPCPLCREEGEDKAGDNLKIKENLVTCFKSKVHTDILRGKSKDIKPVKRKPKEEKRDKTKEEGLKKYLKTCQKNLTSEYGTFSQSRGLRIETLKTLGVGVDLEKTCWVLPVFAYPDNWLIGFEYRDIQLLPRKEGGQLWHEEGTYSCLAQINKKPSYQKDTNIDKKGCVDNIVIIEGFLDGYMFYQYMKDSIDVFPFQILTPSCGVHSISGLLSQLKTKCGFTLILDNDKAGKETREEIKKNSPFGFFNFYVPGEYKDFGEYYNKNLLRR